MACDLYIVECILRIVYNVLYTIYCILYVICLSVDNRCVGIFSIGLVLLLLLLCIAYIACHIAFVVKCYALFGGACSEFCPNFSGK